MTTSDDMLIAIVVLLIIVAAYMYWRKDPAKSTMISVTPVGSFATLMKSAAKTQVHTS
jgi:hypothetical protein